MEKELQVQFENGLSPAERFAWEGVQRKSTYNGIEQPIGPVELPRLPFDEPSWRKILFLRSD